MPYLIAIVKGRVQGVGYRFFAYDVARQIGVRGFVKNLRSGDVEVQADGSEEELQRLVKALWHGPAFSQVTEVETTISPQDKGFTDFQITF